MCVDELTNHKRLTAQFSLFSVRACVCEYTTSCSCMYVCAIKSNRNVLLVLCRRVNAPYLLLINTPPRFTRFHTYFEECCALSLAMVLSSSQRPLHPLDNIRTSPFACRCSLSRNNALYRCASFCLRMPPP